MNSLNTSYSIVNTFLKRVKRIYSAFFVQSGIHLLKYRLTGKAKGIDKNWFEWMTMDDIRSAGLGVNWP